MRIQAIARADKVGARWQVLRRDLRFLPRRSGGRLLGLHGHGVLRGDPGGVPGLRRHVVPQPDPAAHAAPVAATGARPDAAPNAAPNTPPLACPIAASDPRAHAGAVWPAAPIAHPDGLV